MMPLGRMPTSIYDLRFTIYDLRGFHNRKSQISNRKSSRVDIGSQSPEIDIHIGEVALEGGQLLALGTDEACVGADRLADARQHLIKLAVELASHRLHQPLAHIEDLIVEFFLQLTTLGRQHKQAGG